MRSSLGAASALTLLAIGCGSPGGTGTSGTGGHGGHGGHGSTGSTSASSTSNSSSGTGGSPGACAPSTAWAAGFSATREVYVATSGGASGDGSMAMPYPSIAAALRKAMPGDLVHVAAGTYDCSDTYVDGTTGAGVGTMAHPIWIKADAGAIVDCGDPTQGSTGALYLHSVSYVVVEGLELENASGHVIHVDGHAVGVLFKSIHAHRAGLACVKASQSDDISVEDSELADAGLSADANASNASGQIIDNVGVHGAHLVRTKIHGAMGNGSGSLPNVAVQYKGGSHDIVIAQNDIQDAGTAVNLGGQTGPQFFDPPDADYEGKNIVAYANVVRGAMSVAFSAVGCHGCAAYNNTVVAPIDRQALRALPGSLPNGQTSNVENFDVKNNLVVFAGALPQDLFNGNPADITSITQASNLFYAQGTQIMTIYSDVPVVGAPGAVVDLDPQLAGPPGDVHLVKGSPAIGAGVALPMFVADHDGTCRASWDIGAYAYTGM